MEEEKFQGRGERYQRVFLDEGLCTAFFLPLIFRCPTMRMLNATITLVNRESRLGRKDGCEVPSLRAGSRGDEHT